MANSQNFSLPIWKEKAEALGYVLPKPFGINVNYMSLEQGIAVDSIAFGGSSALDFVGKLFDFSAEGGTQSTEVLNLRADVWLLPFLNVYGMAGKITGHSKTTVVMKGRLSQKETRFPFELNLDGDLYGAGLVLVGGYENWFALVDASYTKTNLTVIDGGIDAIVISPRLGYDFNQMGVPLRLWVGGMYQDVEQSLSGDMKSIGLNIPNLESARFYVEQHLSTQWNPIAGAQYQLSPNWYLLGEFGMGERRSAFVSIDYRF
nr:TonB-dependent receptor [Vibrio stylophorae]